MDIPFHKLSNNVFKDFLHRYTHRNIPNQTTLRKYYVSEVYEAKVKSLREKAAGMKLWVSIDETTDVEQPAFYCLLCVWHSWGRRGTQQVLFGKYCMSAKS